MWLEAYIEAASSPIVDQLQLEKHIHRQSALPYPSCGYASRHNKWLNIPVLYATQGRSLQALSRFHKNGNAVSRNGIPEYTLKLASYLIYGLLAI